MKNQKKSICKIDCDITQANGAIIIQSANIIFFSIIIFIIPSEWLVGAGTGTRTPILSLEGCNNSRYTIPARWGE